MDTIGELGKEIMSKKKITAFRPGDTVQVFVRVVEEPLSKKEKPRVRPQIYEGVVIRLRKAGVSSSFTVRKISYGVGVERTFPLYSPHIEKIQVVRSSKVRRARLYFLRKRVGKAARLKEQRNVLD